MKIEVINLFDTDDGGAVMTIDLDGEALMALAKLGLMGALLSAAEQTIKEHAEDPDVV